MYGLNIQKLDKKYVKKFNSILPPTVEVNQIRAKNYIHYTCETIFYLSNSRFNQKFDDNASEHLFLFQHDCFFYMKTTVAA